MEREKVLARGERISHPACRVRLRPIYAYSQRMMHTETGLAFILKFIFHFFLYSFLLLLARITSVSCIYPRSKEQNNQPEAPARRSSLVKPSYGASSPFNRRVHRIHAHLFITIKTPQPAQSFDSPSNADGVLLSIK